MKILMMINILWSMDAVFKGDTVTVNGVACPSSIHSSNNPIVTNIQELKNGIIIVNYKIEAPSTQCLYYNHRGNVLDIKRKRCLGDYLRKIEEDKDNDKDCTPSYQPKWTITDESLHIINNGTDVDQIIKY